MSPRQSIPPAFARLWAAQLAALAGRRTTRFGFVWLLGEGSVAGVTAAYLIALLPTIVLGPFIGVLVDRLPRGRAMQWAEALQAAILLTLTVAAWALPALPLVSILVFLLLSEIAAIVHDAAFNASMPLLLEEQPLLRVQGANQGLYHGLDLLAAPLGVLLAASFGAHGALNLHLALSLGALLAFNRIRVPSPAPAGERHDYWGNLTGGVAALLKHRRVLWLGGLLAAANLVALPAASLSVVLVRDHFAGGPLRFSQLEIASSAGILLGGFGLAALGARHRLGAFFAALVGLGASLFLTGFLPSGAFPVAIALVLVAGLCTPVLVATFLATVQTTVAPALQGRVLTLAGTLVLLPAASALPAAGFLASRLGVVPVFRFAGLLLLSIVVLALALRWWRSAPAAPTG